MLKNIGTTLTNSQYNGIITLLRTKQHKETLKITQTQTGEYGEYHFQLTDTTLLDKGIMVSDETISAEPTITLKKPTFPNSHYYITLTVLHYTHGNITDTTSYKETETITLELKKDTPVPIPTTTINKGYIILYETQVLVKHDKPIVHYMIDPAVTGKKNTAWYNYGNRATVTTDTTGTTLSRGSATTNGYVYALLEGMDTTISNSESYLFDDIILEFDLISTTNEENGVVFYDGTTQKNIIFKDIKATGGEHIKMMFDGSNIIVSVDNDELEPILSNFNSLFRVGFIILPNSNIKYKNFKLTRY